MARTKKAARRGGGYGFSGSILGSASGSNAGNAAWKSDTSKDCGVMANRGGNNTLAGGRRRARRGGVGMVDDALLAAGTGYAAHRLAKKGGRRSRRGGVGAVDDAIFALGTTYVAKRFAKKGGRHTRRHRGGNVLALQQPRAGYTFNGTGSAGLANAVPVAPNTTNV
jgi:hypothetical protein